jgi:hypothetical protein
MKTRRILSILVVPAALVLLAIGCSDDEAITYSVTDVSSRVSGFSNTKSGPGAELTINGSQLQDVQRLFIGTQKVAAKDFIAHTESAITFTVPTSATPNTNGEKTDVLVVFKGSERAYNEIELVPLQAISSFSPYSAAAGETVTLLGVNFNLVTGVRLGSVDATIVSQTTTVLKFTMPTGAPTGRITLVGEAGNSNSTTDLTSCSASPTGPDCAVAVNLNTSFENGAGDNFDSWAKQNGGTFMTATSVPGEVFGGNRAVKVVRNGSLAPDQWRIQLISAAAPTDIGSSYTVYVWAKAVGTPGTMRVSTTPSALYTGDQPIPTTWTRLAFTFTANVASTGVALDMNGAAVTTFFIDDVKLVKN